MKHFKNVESLTVQHVDCDGLLLLDGLSVGEAGEAGVVVSGVLCQHIREVQVSVQRLRHTTVLRQPLEICRTKFTQRSVSCLMSESISND